MTTSSPGWYDARHFGARGDGHSKDTAALQAALDACTAGGGGVVVVPPGRYLTGTLWLKSHTELHLAPGAVLSGSPDRADYNADDAFPENQVFSRENVTGAHLIIARAATDVAITGQGTIDGASSQFFESLPPEQETHTYRAKACNYPIRDWRPAQMVFFCRCQRVAVRDVSLLNAPYWTLFCIGCEDVSIRGVTITNPPQTQNGDGIDIDCCRRVTISDCRIRSGDDCITLRGNPGPLPEAQPCEDVVISNCVLSTPCNAFRIGVGDGEVRRATLSNLVITETRTAIDMVCRYSDRAKHGTHIHDISFSNVVIDAVLPLHLTGGCGPVRPAGLERIRLAGFTVRATAGMYIGSTAAAPLREIALSDWSMHLTGGTDNEDYVAEPPTPFPLHGASGLRGLPALPCALFAEHVHDLQLTDLRLYWDAPLGRVWHDGVLLRDCNGVRVVQSQLTPPRPEGQPLRRVRCHQVTVL